MLDLPSILTTSMTTLLVAVVAALVAARLQSTREHAKWLRERRYEACVQMLRSLAWSDLDQKVGGSQPSDVPFPANVETELEVLGLDRVKMAADRCWAVLIDIEIRVTQINNFDGDLYNALQAEFDNRRAAHVAEVRLALGIKSL